MANWISTTSESTGVVYLENTPNASMHFLYVGITMVGRKPERFILS